MSRIFCPYHLEEEDRLVEAEHIGTYDEEGDENGFGPVEMVRFRCTENEDHTWHHPSQNFWLRLSAWGPEWRSRRDKYQGR